MAPVAQKRQRTEDGERRPKKKIRVKKQKHYHSSSEEEDEPDVPVQTQRLVDRAAPKSILKATKPDVLTSVSNGQPAEQELEGLSELDEADRNAALNTIPDDQDTDAEIDEDEESTQNISGADVSDEDEDDDEDEDGEDDVASEVQSETSSMTSSQAAQARKKRNDPSAFATSISKILDTKLSTSKRLDPVLSRSKSANEANRSIADSKLDAAARAQLRTERKQALDKGRVVDVLGLDDPSVDTGRVQEEEKRLKKIAQRGVVKLFNAVRAAQVKAEEGMRAAREQGTVGMKQREERAQELSKEGFLEMISRGQTKAAA